MDLHIPRKISVFGLFIALQSEKGITSFLTFNFWKFSHHKRKLTTYSELILRTYDFEQELLFSKYALFVLTLTDLHQKSRWMTS